MRRIPVFIKIFITVSLLIFWYFCFDPTPEYKSEVADLWIRTELLYLMIEPFYFQVFLRWLNQRVLDQGLTASFILNAVQKEVVEEVKNETPRYMNNHQPPKNLLAGLLKKSEDNLDVPESPEPGVRRKSILQHSDFKSKLMLKFKTEIQS